MLVIQLAILSLEFGLESGPIPELGRKLAVAVLYSGRWYGLLTQPWIDNQVTNLIQPNLGVASFSIFLTVTPDQWYNPEPLPGDLHSLNSELRSQVAAAFAPYRTASELVTYEGISPLLKSILGRMRTAAIHNGGKPGEATAFTTSQMYGSYSKQFYSVALTEGLRRRSGEYHDLIIRARVDILHLSAAAILPLWNSIVLKRNIMFASEYPGNVVMKKSNITYWTERTFVASDVGMAALAGMVTSGLVLHNSSARCHLFCPEEQTGAQLLRAGMELRPLPWAMSHSPLRINMSYSGSPGVQGHAGTKYKRWYMPEMSQDLH